MDTIKVDKRNLAVSVRQLRKNGIIPGNIHGGQLEHSIAIQMTQAAADQIVRTMHVGTALLLENEGTRYPCLIKEISKDKYGNKIAHFVFQALRSDIEVKSVAHIQVKNAEKVPGQLEMMLFEVPFSALPGDLIDTVVIDLEGKNIGTQITVGDIPEFQNPKVKIHEDPEALVLRISEKRNAPAEEEEAPAAEA